MSRIRTVDKRFVNYSKWEDCYIDVTTLLPQCDNDVTISLQEQKNRLFLKRVSKNLDLLSAKEKRIWGLVAEGVSLRGIGRKLSLDKTQVRRIIKKIKITLEGAI